MCGFSGFLGGATFQDGAAAEVILRQMSNSIAHRGPDDHGYWIDSECRIALGHRRLSIVDLSPAGHQPMGSDDGRYIIAFNGEIYNHLDLRKQLNEELDNPSWRGHSDTETLLAAIKAWGIREAIERSVGMFAFAVWDRMQRTLMLGRDRLGEKPLYYGWQGDSFLFGSELKALRKHPAFRNDIERGSLSLLLRHNCIPAPHSIYMGIYKLLPGTLLEVSVARREPKVITYWSGAQVARAGAADPLSSSPEKVVDELESLLKDAVRKQMVADVSLGAFLSGGVDSSTVVALMQAQSSRPVKTFSIGFNEPGYNEAEHAERVARHLRTEHTELYVSAGQAMAVIPDLARLYDEPFSDSSQIPTFLVSQLAKQHVSVSLSGDAGDELFCGYNRYQMTASLWRKLSMLPISLRGAAAKAITAVSPERWDRLAGLIPGAAHFNNLGDKLHKGAGVLSSHSVDELYLGLVSHHQTPSSLVIGGMEPATLLVGNSPDLAGLSAVQRMMALDMLTYLPDDILVKVDRAAMGVSLETRVPFLDHRVVEFAWRLPQSMKLRDGQSKWALRQVLYHHVPKELIERPKMGFGIPLDKWLRGPLRNWAEALLDETRLRNGGYFEPAPIRKRWLEHLTGQRNWAYFLWDILMFQSWLDEQI